MSQQLPSSIPTTIDEAEDTLLTFYAADLSAVRQMSEKEFRGSAHYAAGMFIRSSRYLWWYEGHPNKDWPVEKPALVHWFNDQGVTHPDDMSDEVLRALWRKVNGSTSKTL